MSSILLWKPSVMPLLREKRHMQAISAAQECSVSPRATSCGRPEFRMEDFEVRCSGVHRRSLQRDLRAPIEKRLIVAEGATNRLIYRMVGNP